jgi:WD40 repeat protein
MSAPATPPPDAGQLQERIIRTYPYPIAVAYRSFTEQESPAAQFGCLLDTFEGLVHFLATVAVSAYFRGPASNTECNRHLLRLFMKENWATGDLLSLLCDTVRLAGDCGGRLPYPELPTHLFKEGGREVLAPFVTLRNRVWGHGTGRDDESFAGLLPANQGRLEQELAAIPWIAQWKLIRPLVIEESGRINKSDVLMGDRRLRGQAWNLTLEPADSPWQGGDVRAEKALLLVAPDARRYLPLFPLSLFHLKDRSQGMFFLQRTLWQSSAEKRQLRKACYVAYESGLGEHAESPGELAVRALEERIRQLEEQLQSAGVAPVAARPEPAAQEDPDHELIEVRHEQASHLRVFAGREELLQRVGQWLGESSESGYLLLLGPPGQGKSALMAELARREQARQGCLLHMVKSHRNPRKFLPALLTQAARLAKTAFGAESYGGDIDDLRNMLLRALEAVRRKTGRAVAVLDALDELEASGERLNFLPQVLPEGARVVLTCRPDVPLVQGLRARLSKLEEWEVPPLSEADLRPVLERRLGTEALQALDRSVDWRALFQRLQGNPLFLQRAIDRLGRTPGVLDLERLPANLEAFFRDIYNEIAERDGVRYATPEGRQKAKLLHLLCVAREPLDVEQLGELIALAGLPLLLEDCRDRLLEMSQFLLDVGENRFKPWHQGLVDFVRGQILGTAGVRQTEELFCTWLRRPAAQLGRYGLRYRVQHLLAAGRAEEVLELMTDLSFLEARAQAGQVYELGADFHDAVWLVGKEHPRRHLLWLLAEALRGEVHAIARHPSLLFQCLWNRCWWYDCPAAEPHYEPPSGGWPPEGPPWQRSGAKLSAFMETWRAAREVASAGTRWLRTLRPPPVPLASAQRTVFRGHTEQVRAAAYSPDMRRVVSAGDDQTVRIWDTFSSRELHCLRSHQGRVYGLAVSTDGGQFASSGEDGSLRICDWDGCELGCLKGHRGPVWSVAYAPDGRQLVSASRDRTVRVWDVASRQQLLCLGRTAPDQSEAPGHTATASCAVFTPDGRRVVSCGWDRTVRVWDAETGRELLCLAAHRHRTNAVAVSPDGGRIVSAARDGELKLWDAEHGTMLAQLCLDDDWVGSVAFSPDGRYIVSGSNRGNGLVFDGRTLARIASQSGHDGSINSAVFSPDGRRVVSASWDRTVRVWNVLGGATATPLRGDGIGVLMVAFSHDGRLLATGDVGGAVRLWDPLTGLERACWTGHQSAVRALRFSADDRRLASGSRDNTIRIWDVADDREVTCLRGHEATVRDVAFSPDGRTLLSGSRDRTARLWDIASGAERLLLTGHTDVVHAVAIDAEGRRLATGDVKAGTIRIWNATDGRQLVCLGDEEHTIDKLAFAPDGRSVAARSWDGTVRVWDLESRRCAKLETGPRATDAASAWLRAVHWNIAVSESEVAFLAPATGMEEAWFPLRLSRLTADATGQTCAGIHANRLWLFRREGAGW